MRAFTGVMFAAVAVVLTVSVAAQPELAFEVASIRPAMPGAVRTARVTPTRLDLVNHELLVLVLHAFRKEVYEVSTPDWLRQARFDIHATYPAGATQAQVPEMLQTLLASRFGLVTHVEPRRVDAYDLVIGKGGVAMQEVEPVDEVEKDFTTSGDRPVFEGRSETFEGPSRLIALSRTAQRVVTTRSLYERRTTSRGTMQIDATRISVPEFAELLRLNLDKPVIDRTGLKGLYQFKVELDRDLVGSRIFTIDVNGNPIKREPTGVDTFKAVERLGLKLEERREPLDVLVVDKMERAPTEN